MDTTLVQEFTRLHAKAKTGGLDAREHLRWTELKRRLIAEQSESADKPVEARPISRPG